MFRLSKCQTSKQPISYYNNNHNHSKNTTRNNDNSKCGSCFHGVCGNSDVDCLIPSSTCASRETNKLPRKLSKIGEKEITLTRGRAGRSGSLGEITAAESLTLVLEVAVSSIITVSFDSVRLETRTVLKDWTAISTTATCIVYCLLQN